MLNRAFEKSSGLTVENVDFKIPEVDSIVQGSKTMVRNINSIAGVARRSKEEIAKYLTKEIAAPISFDQQSLIISARVSNQDLNAKMKKYFDMYIICKECHKPDTHVQSMSRGYVTIVCEACGAKYTVKNY